MTITLQVKRHSGASDDDSAHHRMSGHIDDVSPSPASPQGRAP